MKPTIKEKLAVQRFTSFSEVLDRALRIEKVHGEIHGSLAVKEMRPVERSREKESTEDYNKKRKFENLTKEVLQEE